MRKWKMQIRHFRKLWLNPANKLVLYFVIPSDVKPHHSWAKYYANPCKHSEILSEIHLTNSFGYKFSLGKVETKMSNEKKILILIKQNIRKNRLFFAFYLSFFFQSKNKVHISFPFLRDFTFQFCFYVSTILYSYDVCISFYSQQIFCCHFFMEIDERYKY